MRHSCLQNLFCALWIATSTPCAQAYDPFPNWLSKQVAQLSETVLGSLVNADDIRTYHTINELKDVAFDVTCTDIWDILEHKAVYWTIVILLCLSFISVFAVVLVYAWSQYITRTTQKCLYYTDSKVNVILFQYSIPKLICSNLGIFISFIMIIFFSLFFLIAGTKGNNANYDMFHTLQETVIGGFKIKEALIKEMQSFTLDMNKIANRNIRHVYNITSKIMKRHLREASDFTYGLVIASNHIDELNNEIKLTALSNMEKVRSMQAFFISYEIAISDYNRSLYHNYKVSSEHYKDLLVTLRKIPFRTIELHEELSRLKQVQLSELGWKINSSFWEVTLPTLSGFSKVPLQLKLDFTEYAKQLERDVFDHLRNVTDEVQNMIAWLKWVLPVSNRNQIIDELEQKKADRENESKYVQLILLTIAVSAFSFAFPIAIGAFIGLCGTGCFEGFSSKGYKRNLLSNSGGNIIEAGLYIASLFMWLFWILSALFLLTAVINHNICTQFKDRTILHFPLQKHTKGLPSKLQKNITAKDLLTTCESRDIYRTLEKYRVFVMHRLSSSANITFNVSNAHHLFKNVKRINFTIPDSELDSLIEHARLTTHQRLNITKNITQNLKVAYTSLRHAIKVMKKFGNQISDPEFRRFLRDMNADSTRVLKTINVLVLIATKYHRSDLALKKHFKSHFPAYREALHKAAKEMNKYLNEEAANELINQIYYSTKRNNDGISFAMSYPTESHRNQMSTCVQLAAMYKSISSFVCNLHLQSAAMIWVSVTVLAFFLALSIVCGIPVAGALKLPHTSGIPVEHTRNYLNSYFIMKKPSSISLTESDTILHIRSRAKQSEGITLRRSFDQRDKTTFFFGRLQYELRARRGQRSHSI